MKKSKNFCFKQFEIIQQKSAMKVGTDGVLLGAWVNVSSSVGKILDIGTGTGLIALMLAQRSSAEIHAVELDKGACSEAIENFKNAPWFNRMTAFEGSISSYAESCSTRYDLIVCNPPFFTNGVRAAVEERSKARHTDTLSFAELIAAVEGLLTKTGFFSVVLPIDQKTVFVSEAKNKGLYLSRQLLVLPNDTRPAKRVLLTFVFDENIEYSEDVLQIETNERHCYTEEYKELTKEFYLAF